MEKQILKMKVNGVDQQRLVAPNALLLEVLREDMRLTGTKFGCELGECGVCTVLVDGVPVLSCIMLAALCHGKSITTVEGLEGHEADAIKQAFAEEGASQCGYCTPSMTLMLSSIIKRGEDVNIREELSGNMCRCTGYTKIIKAYERSVEIAKK